MMFSSRRILLTSLSLALVLCNHGVVSQEAQDVEEVQSSSSQRRELWDAWSIFSMIVQKIGPDPCHGPDPMHRCQHNTNSNSNGDDNSQGDDASDSSSTQTYNSNVQADYTADDAAAAGETTAEYEDRQTANGGSSAVMSSQLNMWLFVTVASVVAAVGAIHIGQKKNPNGSRGRHELTGVVSRRATLVSAFANGLMPGKETPIADEGVEVSPGLSLDYSPTGEVEMHPGYNLA